MSLREYNDKRNFKNTNEPIGKIKKSKTKRFVIQYHKARANHYDLRLEYNGVLLSWAVPKGLSKNPNVKRLAVSVEDHPLDYISFEGIIPKGNYGAGSVEIYDKGTYVSLKNMKESIKNGHIKVFFEGEVIKGEWSLIKIDEKNWLIVKSKDEYSLKKEKTVSKNTPFNSCDVTLATLKKDIPIGKNWIYEIKYDGYRCLVFKGNNKIKLLSRNNIEYKNKFENIKKSLLSIEESSFVLDGEIVSFDENGRSDFSLLQSNIKSKNNNIHYVIFDLLALNGFDLRKTPLKERKEKLERLLFNCKENLIYSKHVKEGKACFLFAKKHNLEGIIAKKIDSIYKGKRTEDWLKIKCYNRQEFIICGYKVTPKNEELSALLLGYYNDDKLIYAGKVGTGFNESSRKELNIKFKKYIRKSSPFEFELKEKSVIWLKPHFICEIQYAEFTKDMILRQPSFIGLRNDKTPKDVVLEKKYEKNRNN